MKPTLTRAELRDVIISIAVLGFIFSFKNWPTIEHGLKNMMGAMIIAGISFLVQQLAHKLSAEKYNCYAEYVLWPKCLLFTIVLIFLTNGNIMLAAPGFVAISTAYFTRLGFKYTQITQEEFGKIAATGPLANMGLAMIFKIFSPINPIVINQAITINCWMALSNMLPIPPLPGSRVLSWSRIAWPIMQITPIILLLLLPNYNIFISLVAIIPLAIVIFLIGQRIR